MLATCLPHMRDSNLQIRIAGSTYRPPKKKNVKLLLQKQIPPQELYDKVT